MPWWMRVAPAKVDTFKSSPCFLQMPDSMQTSMGMKVKATGLLFPTLTSAAEAEDAKAATESAARTIPNLDMFPPEIFIVGGIGPNDSAPDRQARGPPGSARAHRGRRGPPPRRG